MLKWILLLIGIVLVGWVLVIWILNVLIWISSALGFKPSPKISLPNKEKKLEPCSDFLKETDDYIAQQEFESKSGISQGVSHLRQ